MNKILYCFLYLLLLIGVMQSMLAQEIVIIPNGILQKGDSAEVTGDYVRVRSGPTLEHRILTKVNKRTQVTVLKRGETPVEINGMKNYWYNIKLENSSIEGWMFGIYLRKVEIASPAGKPETPSSVKKNIRQVHEASPVFRKAGNISMPPSLITTGDLNQNGIPEIIFVYRENRKSYWNVTGYECGGFSETDQGETNSGDQNSLYTQAYSGKFRNTDINSVKILTQGSEGSPFLAVCGDLFSYIYSYDVKRNSLYLAYKIDSPIVASGRLDGENDFLVYLRKNRVTDNDGTITYYINASHFESHRGRIRLKDKITYPLPLPVKKMITYDLDGDNKSEIICEIGGNDKGGGLALLSLANGAITKIVNTGVITYNDAQFIRLWGTAIHDTPKLILYTTDPDKGNNVGISLGFLSVTLSNNHISIDKYYPVNKMLDDINNTRTALLYRTDIEDMPFILLDYDESTQKYTIKKPVLQ